MVRLNLALLNADDPARRATIVNEIGDMEGRLPSEFLEGKTAIDPVSLAQLQADLGPQQAIVEYVLDDSRSYALSITRTSVNRYILPPKKALEQEARAFDLVLRNESLTWPGAETVSAAAWRHTGL